MATMLVDVTRNILICQFIHIRRLFIEGMFPTEFRDSLRKWNEVPKWTVVCQLVAFNDNVYP